MKVKDVFAKVQITLPECDGKLLRYIQARLFEPPKLETFHGDEDENLIREIWIVFDENANDFFEEIADSHINANVPTDEEFAELLKRDIKSYLKIQFKQDCYIEHQLLRKGPTQVGVAYPKFYLWVTAKYLKKKVAEGAMRVAAINKLQFDVTHFVTIDEIRSKPEIIKSIFPGPVCERIIGIINEKS